MEQARDQASTDPSGLGIDDDAIDWGAPPRVDALSYPGRWPANSVLVTGDAHWSLHPQPDRRMGLALVDWTRGAEPPAEIERRLVPLHYALLKLNQAAMDRRVPVLAVGSNASPAQLRHKFLPRPGHTNGEGADGFDGQVPATVPMVAAEVEGMKVGVAAQVAPYGALPATPVFGAGLSCLLFVQFLDPHQLCRMDETEGVADPEGGYDRVYLPAGDEPGSVRVRLPSGEVLGGCYAYVARCGHLADPHARVRQPLAAIDQEIQLGNMLAASDRLRRDLGETPRAWIDTVSARPGEMERVVLRILHDEGWVMSTTPGLEATGARVSTAAAGDRLYGDLLPYDEHQPGPRTFRIVPSTTPKERPDETMVIINPAACEAAFGPDAPRYVAVSRPTDDRNTQHLEVLARVMLDADVPERCIQTDHLVRTALGTEVGEPVRLAVRRTGRRRWVDWLLGPPRYLTCRTQYAELALIERQACALDQLALDLLGLESGDEVIVEGQPADSSDQVASLHLKALAAPEGLHEMRKSIERGGFEALVPSAFDALGVHPDHLPWIYVDGYRRLALGLEDQQLATVRVRASRSFQLRRELREMLLVLAITAFAVLEFIPDLAGRLATGLALLTVTGWAIAAKMRGRLSARSSGPLPSRLPSES